MQRWIQKDKNIQISLLKTMLEYKEFTQNYLWRYESSLWNLFTVKFTVKAKYIILMSSITDLEQISDNPLVSVLSSLWSIFWVRSLLAFIRFNSTHADSTLRLIQEVLSTHSKKFLSMVKVSSLTEESFTVRSFQLRFKWTNFLWRYFAR